MKRRTIALLLLLAALLLAGCAKKPETEPPQVDPAPTVEPTVEPEAPPEVENNGGHYVRVGDSVYFRRYGADALPGFATHGEFTETWNVDGESELMAYNTKTGELTELYRECGSGALWYGDGGFYLSEHANGDAYTAWYALDGSGARTVGPGSVVGVTDSGLLAVAHTDWYDSYEAVYTFYRGGTPVGEASTDESLMEAGLTDDGLFLLSVSYPYDDAPQTYGFVQITPEGEIIRLGELAMDEDYFYSLQADRFLAADGKALFGVGFYAGTGHFFDYGVFAEATVGQADSIQVLEPEIDTTELYELPYPTSNGAGGYDYADAPTGALRGGWDEEDSLELWEDGAWRQLSPHFAPRHADGWAAQRIVQYMDYVDGAAYVTAAVACAAPGYDIGWREGYALASMRYLKVERDGTVTELDCVDHETELFGWVWLVEGASVALWQQLNSEDGEGWFAADYVYALPIADDAYWDDGAFDGVTGLLPYDYGEGEAGDYGYPVPDAEPAGELCLALDRDGAVIALMRKDPAAVMIVDFDVPEDELAGAAATLPLERRECDEDTPYHWAALRVLENGVRVRLERTPEQTSEIEQIAMFDGAFVAGETVYDGVLNRGEFLAVRVTLPWHPELRVSVSKNGERGGYIFGEDNYLHLEDEYGSHPGLTLAVYPMSDPTEYSGAGLSDALLGAWLHRSADGEADAELLIDPGLSIRLTRAADLEQFELTGTPGRLYNAEWDEPDLLCLTTEDAALTELLGFGPNVGDYAVELFRTEGEEILHLTQRNNGDGALGTLLPDADGKWTYDFVFTRDYGTCDAGARRCGMTFDAEIAKLDRDAGLCALREAELAESDPSIGDVWRAKPDAPCLTYPVTASAAAALDGTYPMRYCTVTTDADGTITSIRPID